MTRTSLLRLMLLPLFAVVLTVVWIFVPVRQLAEDFQAAVEERGRYWGLLLIALAYTPACLTFFPTLLLTIAAGALYGDTWDGIALATLAITLGALLAAAIAFVIGRFLARGWIENKVANSERFRALDRAVGEHGFRIVLLVRLSPAFPFTLSSYVFGVTKVRWRDYLVASWVGMIPGTLMYLSIGRAAKGIATLLGELREGKVVENLGQLAVTLLGVVATIAIVVVVTRVARKALREAIPEEPSHG